jgi:hypothetical protein
MVYREAGSKGNVEQATWRSEARRRGRTDCAAYANPV